MLELDIILNDPILREVYRRGIKRGVDCFAEWKDDKEVVGILNEDYNKVITDVDKGLYDE